MNLGVVEVALLRVLRRQLGDGILWRRGAPAPQPEAGLLPEVFVEAQGLQAHGDPPARQTLPDGWREQGAACLDVLLHARCGRHEQAQALAGRLVLPALAVLDRFGELPLSEPGSGHMRLLRPAARLLQTASASGLPDTALVQLHFRLGGVLETELRGIAAGLIDPLAPGIRLVIEADPAGLDMKAERVLLQLDADEAPLPLGGWQLRDAAGHAFVFAPDCRLLPGAALSLWTRRGKADAHNLFWGRRKPVWNNTGDVALLVDAQGREQARVHWQPPLPKLKRRKPS